jgi:hypothetical protein
VTCPRTFSLIDVRF